MAYTCEICGGSYYDPKECFYCVNRCFNNYRVGKLVYDVRFSVDKEISKIGFRPDIALDAFGIVTHLPINAQHDRGIYHRGWLLYDQVADFKELSRALFDKLIKEQLINWVGYNGFENRCVITDSLIRQFERAHDSFWEDLLYITHNQVRDCREARHLGVR